MTNIRVKSKESVMNNPKLVKYTGTSFMFRDREFSINVSDFLYYLNEVLIKPSTEHRYNSSFNYYDFPIAGIWTGLIEEEFDDN